MQKEKLEQLRIVFKNVIKQTLRDSPKVWGIYSSPNNYAEEIAKKLIYEVKIRINNRKGVSK